MQYRAEFPVHFPSSVLVYMKFYPILQYRAEFPVHFPSSVLVYMKFYPILQFRVVRTHDVSPGNVVYPGTGNLDIRPPRHLQVLKPHP